MKNSVLKLTALIAATSVCTAITIHTVQASCMQKMVICHIPPGNPDNIHSIEVGLPSVPAHLAHGDNLELCPGQTEITPYHDGDDGNIPVNITMARPVSIFNLRSVTGN